MPHIPTYTHWVLLQNLSLKESPNLGERWLNPRRRLKLDSHEDFNTFNLFMFNTFNHNHRLRRHPAHCPSPPSGSFGYANIAAASRDFQFRASSVAVFTKGTKFYGNSNMETKREYFVHYFLYFYLKFRAKHWLACVQTSPIPFVAHSTSGPLMYL